MATGFVTGAPSSTSFAIVAGSVSPPQRKTCIVTPSTLSVITSDAVDPGR